MVVGIHASGFPGPQPELGLFVNIQQDPRDIGRAQADWIIDHSGGKARVVVTSHCEYAIACAKAHATEERIKECPGCEMLEFSNSPIAEVAQRQPALVTAWVQKYGTPLYITSVADYTADFQIPALRAGGVDPKDVIIVSADGNKSAYERIRVGGQYQLVTASEPYGMQAYQAIDELNRAFTGSRRAASSRRLTWSRRRTSMPRAATRTPSSRATTTSSAIWSSGASRAEARRAGVARHRQASGRIFLREAAGRSPQSARGT